MMHRTSPVLTAVILLVLAALPVLAADYPEIRVLTRDDLLYVQQQAELEEYYRLSKLMGAPEIPPVSIFSYEKKKSDDIFSLNARLGLPYDALASLNGAADTRSFNALQRILVPSQPGVFVRIPPRSPLEQMVLAARQSAGAAVRQIVLVRGGKTETLAFFPGATFSPVERAYFLGILFQFPVALSVVRGFITSPFGMRKDPFSGQPEFHNGMDIAAAEGTLVRAARDGAVAEAGKSEVLGSYVVISHPGGWQTVYGHLSTIRVTLNQRVEAGAEIGRVGRTGRATGSHLHFEVRRKGNATDPFPLLAAAKKITP